MMEGAARKTSLRRADVERVPGLGDRMWKARRARKLSQQDLAQAIGLSRVTLCKIENEKTPVSAVTLMKIARALEVKTGWLLGLEKTMSDDDRVKIGAIPLTPELMDQISQTLEARKQDIMENYPKLVEACPYETKLAVVVWAFEAIVENAMLDGSFRHLIYTLMNFNKDAYYPLYMAGGQMITNELNLELYKHLEEERKKDE